MKDEDIIPKIDEVEKLAHLVAHVAREVRRNQFARTGRERVCCASSSLRRVCDSSRAAAPRSLATCLTASRQQARGLTVRLGRGEGEMTNNSQYEPNSAQTVAQGEPRTREAVCRGTNVTEDKTGPHSGLQGDDVSPWDTNNQWRGVFRTLEHGRYWR